jgi:hypothetical protein
MLGDANDIRHHCSRIFEDAVIYALEHVSGDDRVLLAGQDIRVINVPRGQRFSIDQLPFDLEMLCDGFYVYCCHWLQSLSG